MNALIYAYTIVLMLICFAAAMMSVAAYAVSHRKVLIPQAAFFIFYIIEIASILGEEFVSQNIPFSPDQYYEVTMPMLRIITGAGILHSLWLMLLDILDEHDSFITYAPTCLFVVGCVAVLTMLPYGQQRQWLFYTLRQAYIGFGLAYSFWKWKSSSSEHYRKRLESRRGNYVLLWILLALILLEDAYIILIAPIPSAENGWLSLYLSTRNFSENVMMLFVAYHSIRSSLETLSLRFSEPPASRDAADADLMRHIEKRLPSFAAEHALSSREKEVLGMVLEGMDNRRISQELYLSEGTIKTHVFNIMRKTQTRNRDELKQVFWAS